MEKKIEEYIEEYKIVLKKYAYTLTHNKEDAEDLLQDTILKILVVKHLYKEDLYFRSWASRIMRNLFIDQYRKNVKMPIVKLNTTTSIVSENGESIDILSSFSDKNSLENFNSGEAAFTIRDIQEEIEDLRDDYKQVIKLRLEGYSFREMEDILGIPSPKMRSMHFKGTKILRKILRKKLSL